MAFRSQLEDFASFYETTYAMTYWTALGVVRDATLAADVTQDAYTDAYRNRHGFRGDVPADAWLQKIVVNASISAVRRRSVRRVDPLDHAAPDTRPSGSAGVIDRVTLDAAMRSLSPQQRAAVVLRYFHDYDYRAIAEVLGSSVSNVGALLSRALDSMHTTIDGPPGPARRPKEATPDA